MISTIGLITYEVGSAIYGLLIARRTKKNTNISIGSGLSRKDRLCCVSGTELQRMNIYTNLSVYICSVSRRLNGGRTRKWHHKMIEISCEEEEKVSKLGYLPTTKINN